MLRSMPQTTASVFRSVELNGATRRQWVQENDPARCAELASWESTDAYPRA